MNTVRIKRRAAGGGPGAPTSMANAELAFNEQTKTLYYGLGIGGVGGTATAAIPIGGDGAFVDAANDQTIGGVKTFSASPIVPTKAPSDDSTAAATTAFVQAAVAGLSLSASWGGITGTVTNQADLVSYIAAQIAALVNSAPGALDQLNELAAAIGNDPNFATTLTNSLAGKADLVLSNLSNFATARTNLGLGTLATQAANAVAITGGTIDGITFDGGTF